MTSACSLVTSTENLASDHDGTSTSRNPGASPATAPGLDGSSPGPHAPDRAPNATDAGSAPSPTRDAGADASTTSPAPETCGALLCDDFERATLLGGWEQTNGAAGGVGSIATSLAHAGTHSFRVDLTTTNDSRFHLDKALPKASRVAITYFVDVATAGRSMTLAPIWFADATITRSVALAYDASSDQVTFAEQEFTNGAQTKYVPHGSASFVAGRFVQVHVEIVRGASGDTITASFDGQPVVNGQGLQPLPMETSWIGFGVDWSDSGAQMPIYFDDVRIEVVPLQ